MPASTESSLVLAACTFALSASCADLSLAFIIEYSALRASTRAAQASLAGLAQAAGTNASPRPNTVVTAIDWMLVIDNPFLQKSVTLSQGSLKTTDQRGGRRSVAPGDRQCRTEIIPLTRCGYNRAALRIPVLSLRRGS